MAKFTMGMISVIVLSISISAMVLAKAPPKDDPKAEAKAEAFAQYKKLMECYKSGSLTNMKDELKNIRRVKSLLPRQAQLDIAYIPKTLAQYRPPWWRHMKSSTNVSFKITLWGRPLMTNFMPSDSIGKMIPIDIKNGRLRMAVSWRPNMIDNPDPAGGYLAKRHKLTKGAVGESIGWCGLGLNYIVSFMPVKKVIILYENHEKFFIHLQMFYADMTTYYHSSPGGRLAHMFSHLSYLQQYDETSGHDRSGFAIGSIILANVLSAPDKWPGFHFPSSVPTTEIELNTIRYLYEQIDPNWSVNEDKAFRMIVKKVIKSQGSKVLRSKGKIMLPNRIPFMLMVSDDRKYQKKRDAWVKEKLEKIIGSGRADKTRAVTNKSLELPIKMR
ncbi:MAG: hypothetical protein GY794_08275 [bacterium]|nr:hypothetical protein [bacterium]